VETNPCRQLARSGLAENPRAGNDLPGHSRSQRSSRSLHGWLLRFGSPAEVPEPSVHPPRSTSAASRHPNLSVESDLAVAAALTAAARFTPLRRRIQRWVDRRFNRTRYVAEREPESFTDRLRDTTEIDTTQADLIGVIHSTLQPSIVGVWIRGQSE
jgi:hypothetical protein